MIPKDQQSRKVLEEEPNEDLIWALHVDGASNSQGSSAGLILTNWKGIIIKFALYFTFKVSNNQAKYEALLASLKVAKELGMKRLKVFIDFQLVAK